MPSSRALPPPVDPSAAGLPWTDPAVVAATCGWLGRAPAAPGTLGAAAGIGVSAALAGLGLAAPVEAAIVVALNLVGIPLCTAAARRLGRGSDPGAIVFDELASVPLALLAIPAAARATLPTAGLALGAAFVLHRAFDIAKPFPCRQLERLPAGLGIMADDWGAAAWTAAILAAGRWCGWL